jgi:4-hydroxybenzoate polyprenyltransferase
MQDRSELSANVAVAGTTTRRWAEYLKPLRFDHWIKNLVVPIGSVLALVAGGSPLTRDSLVRIVLAFVLSGLVSSINYALNEILDAPFDARHPVKRFRPIPAGRVRVKPLLVLTAVVGAVVVATAASLFSTPFLLATAALFLAGLVYNLPPVRLKDRPFLDAVVESFTNPVRLAIGWYAVSDTAGGPPLALLGAVWGFGAFLMTGKRLAELRELADLAAHYRPTFRAYSVRRLLAVQLGYALLALATLAGFLASSRPRVLIAFPLVVLLLAWSLRMTFEPHSPLVDPEHLYRRLGFLLVACGVLVSMVLLAIW